MIRRIYKSIYKRSPEKLKSYLTKSVSKLSSKPFVLQDNINPQHKFPGGQRGGMIISADFELAWAWRYAKSFDDPQQVGLEMARQARGNFPFLLKILEQYHIPITFATVGHLFLDSCNKGDHDWMHQIYNFENRNWNFQTEDWFEHDPYSSVHKDNEWYAPDLIQQIRQSKVEHEIGNHTFSHIDFSDKNCPAEVAEDEIKASVELARESGIKLKSMVFPGGTFGNIPVLNNYGFEIYRKNIKQDLAYPYRDKYGLLVTPTSLAFGSNFSDWSVKDYVKTFEKYIDKAIKTNTIAHFWFHPSLDEWTLKYVMPKVLDYANQCQKSGVLWVGTMQQIAEHINENKIL